jgi:hypothetical protein
MAAKFEETRFFKANKSTLFRNCLSIVKDLGFTVNQVDINSGLIQAKTKFNMRSFSEGITIGINENGSVRIKSECLVPIQILDWGKNKGNVNNIFNKLTAADLKVESENFVSNTIGNAYKQNNILKPGIAGAISGALASVVKNTLMDSRTESAIEEPLNDLNGLALDTNRDGIIDTLAIDANHDHFTDAVILDSNFDGSTDSIAIDQNFDGIIDTIVLDTNNDNIIDAVIHDGDFDGITDIIEIDQNYDGLADALMLDTNNDSVIDAVMVDSDFDGIIDVIAIDENYDGIMELGEIGMNNNDLLDNSSNENTLTDLLNF